MKVRYLVILLVMLAAAACSKKDPQTAVASPVSGGGTVVAPPGPAEIISVGEVKYDRAEMVFTVAAGPTMTESGICWGTVPQPSIVVNTWNMFVHNNSGHTFTSEAVGLKRETKYFVRAFARNAEETFYGKVHSFITPFPDLNEAPSWESIEYILNNHLLSTHSNVICAAPLVMPNTLMLSFSSDDGKNWSSNMPHTIRGSRLSDMFFGNNHYVLITDSGVYSGWNRYSVPIAWKTTNVRAVSGNQKMMLACTATQLFMLTITDTAWKKIPVQFPSDTLNAMLMKGDDIYLGTNNGIYKGTSANVRWSKLSSEPTLKLISTTYGIFSITRSGAIVGSTNDGASWIALPELKNVMQLCGDGPNLFAICKNSSDLFVSRNWGLWTKFGVSLPDELVSITITENYLVLSTKIGVYRKKLY